MTNETSPKGDSLAREAGSIKGVSFSTFLTLILIGFVGIPLVWGAFSFQRNFLQEEDRRIELASQSLFDRVQNTLQQEIRLMGARVNTLGNDSDLQMGNRSVLFYGRINQRLTEFRLETSVVSSVYFFGSQNRLIAASPSELEIQDLGEIQTALKSAQEKSIDAFFVLKVAGRENLYVLFQPVVDIFGSAAGSLLAFVDLDALKKLAVEGVAQDPSLPGLRIVEREQQNGEAKDLTVTLGGDLNGALGGSLAESKNLAKDLTLEPGGGKKGENPGLRSLRTRPVDLGDLQLNLVLDVSSRLQESAHLQKRNLILSIIGAALGMLLTWGISRLFLRPLKSLERQIQAFQRFGLASRNFTLPDPTPTPFQEFNDFQKVLYEMGSELTKQVQVREESLHREAELKRQHLSAQLNTLKSQINPHFLFNALNGIQSMMDVSQNEASLMVQDLSDLYRNILRCTDKLTIPLEEEIQIVKKYLSLQKRRFGKRLEFEFEICPDRNLWIPSLMIQTLVENAVKHGLEPYKEGCKVVVSVKKETEGSYLCQIINCRLCDSMVPQVGPVAQALGTGTGLSNTEARLNLLYGTKLELKILPLWGAEVTFEFSGQMLSN